MSEAMVTMRLSELDALRHNVARLSVLNFNVGIQSTNQMHISVSLHDYATSADLRDAVVSAVMDEFDKMRERAK